MSRRKVGKRRRWQYASPWTRDWLDWPTETPEQMLARYRRVGWVIPNDWAWVTPQLATGGVPTTRAEMDRIVAAGISVVINCADDLREVADAVIGGDGRVAYVANPAPDDYRPKRPEWFGVTVGAAVPVIASGGKVLVHCISGSNRGPSNAYCVLRALGASRGHAERLVREARPLARLQYLNDADRAVEAA